MITAPEDEKKLMGFLNKIGNVYFARTCGDEFGVAVKEHHIDLFDEQAGSLLCDLTLWDGAAPLEKGWTLFNPSQNENGKNVATIAYIKDLVEDAIDAVAFYGVYIEASEKINFRERDVLELDGDIYLIKSQQLDVLLKNVYDIRRERLKEISEQRTIAGFNDPGFIENIEEGN